jgi:outer membrane autotransporter protein
MLENGQNFNNKKSKLVSLAMVALATTLLSNEAIATKPKAKKIELENQRKENQKKKAQAGKIPSAPPVPPATQPADPQKVKDRIAEAKKRNDEAKAAAAHKRNAELAENADFAANLFNYEDGADKKDESRVNTGNTFDAEATTASESSMGDTALKASITQESKDIAAATADLAVSSAISISDTTTSIMANRIDEYISFATLNRMASASVNNTSGGSAGEESFSQPVNVWVKGFGGHAKQKASKNSIGFKASNSGGMIGVDTMINDSNLLGIAFSHAELDAKYKGTKINSKTTANVVTAYLSSHFTDELFLNSQVKFGKAKLKTSGVSTMKAKGTLAGIREELGYAIKLEDGIMLTPSVGVSYDEVKLGKFRNTAAGKDQDLSGKKNKRVNALAGLNVAKTISMDGYSIVPSAHVNVEHTLSSKNKAMKISGVDDSAESILVPQKKAAKTSYIVGAGLKLVSLSKMEVGINYDMVKRNKFTSHNGSIKLRVNF